MAEAGLYFKGGMIVFGMVHLLLALVAGRMKSWVAAVVLLLLFSVQTGEHFMTSSLSNLSGLSLLILLIIVAASYRLTKARFYIHQSRKAQQVA